MEQDLQKHLPQGQDLQDQDSQDPVILGIDVGGSGIKAAPVNIKTGKFVADRLRIETPQPATPKAVAKVITQLVEHFSWQGKPIGCAFPAIVKEGVIFSAANIDKSWLGTNGKQVNVKQVFEQATNSKVVVLNDADAAGIAEMTYGAGVVDKNTGKNLSGTVCMFTFGTGIGSALFINGILVPNTELGHLDIDDHKDVEKWAAAKVREDKDLSWKKWGKRVNTYLEHINVLFSPDLIIIGGGVSKNSEKFFKFLTVKTKVVPAELRNHAGIIGAALATQ